MRTAVILLGCLAVAVAGFVVARSAGTDGGSTTPSETEVRTTISGTATTTTTKAPAVEQATLRATGGQPAGGTRTISVRSGTPVRLTVVSDTADEAHLHGYDVERELEPNRPATIRLAKTNLEGVFELELHHSGAVLARLEVTP